MGSLNQLPDIPALLPLEYTAPKGFVRYVFPFELSDDYDLDEIATILKIGYEGTKKQVVPFNCELVPDTDASQPGVTKLQRMPDGVHEDFLVKDLRAEGSFPMAYPELKEKGFPVAAFHADTVFSRPVWSAPGERLPVSTVQANFICGGVILTWAILHTVGDGKTFATWMKIWAQECCHAQGIDVSKPFGITEELTRDRHRLKKSSGRNKGSQEDHPELTVLPFTPPGMPPKMLSPNHRGQIFYFSPESLAALKEEASPVNATEPTDLTWISTNDALSALLWRTVMAVQSPLETLEGDPASVFNIAIDARSRTEPPVHPETIGCFLAYVAATASIRKMLSTYSLADLAILIRKSLLRANNQFTDDVTTLIEGLEDVNRLVPTAMLDVPGFNCVQTSWVKFELYDYDWGKLGKIQAMRSPHVGIINGLQVVLPVLPDGGMEILVGVEETCIDRLQHDPLWTKFAKAR
ncbi:hypothetical protein ACHAQH_009930 [Verticillium albo-atrum]